MGTYRHSWVRFSEILHAAPRFREQLVAREDVLPDWLGRWDTLNTYKQVDLQTRSQKSTCVSLTSTQNQNGVDFDSSTIVRMSHSQASARADDHWTGFGQRVKYRGLD